jgi:hypothetical protein
MIVCLGHVAESHAVLERTTRRHRFLFFELAVVLGRCKILEEKDPIMTTWQKASIIMVMILHGHQRSLVGV